MCILDGRTDRPVIRQPRLGGQVQGHRQKKRYAEGNNKTKHEAHILVNGLHRRSQVFALDQEKVDRQRISGFAIGLRVFFML